MRAHTLNAMQKPGKKCIENAGMFENLNNNEHKKITPMEFY